jgi:aldehyde:ferredoxin oxidoreductase
MAEKVFRRTRFGGNIYVQRGKTTKEVNKKPKEKVEREDQIFSCGSAAENKVRLSCIRIGERSIGRGGAGAVMALKKIKNYSSKRNW